MAKVACAVLRQSDRFLLAQRSPDGIWIFPGGNIDLEDKTAIYAANRGLKKEVGLEGERFRKLFNLHTDNCNAQVFLCDRWRGELRPVCKDIIGVGWFTYLGMHTLGQSLAPLVSDSLLYLSYIVQHYDHHPNEWKEHWRIIDDI